MKKTLKIILIVFVVLSFAVGGLAIWQWKNIEGIIIGVSEDSAEIERRRSDNQTKLAQDVSAYMDEPLREMTEEEKELLKNGKISAAEIYQQIFEEKKTELKDGKPKKTADNSAKKDEIISRYMAELYRVQSEFVARAEATIVQGANYYESINEHPQDPVARAKTITHFTPIVKGIESECNAKVDSLIANMKNELQAIDADISIIDSIRKTYENEKQLKLSYYANKYLK